MAIVTGARLTAGGLHLGHYVGCFTSLIGLDGDVTFIIGDRGVKDSPTTTAHLIHMVADIRASAAGRPLRATLQTKLHTAYEDVLHEVEGIVTFRQLQASHPAKRRFREGTFDGSVTAFLFPLDSACSYLVLDADIVAMNDDNRRIVALTQQIAKRMNNAAQEEMVVVPRLVHGRVPRLIGFNYKKMAKGNANAIFLSDENDAIVRKVEDLLSVRFLFKTYPDIRIAYEDRPQVFTLPAWYAPLNILHALGYTEEDTEQFRSLHARASLRTILVDTLISVITPLREHSARLRNEPLSVLADLHEDQRFVCSYAAARSAAIVAYLHRS